MPPRSSTHLLHAAYSIAPAPVRRAVRERVRAEIEDRPGVYRMIGATGLVLYVGKSKRLRARLLSYFRAGARNRRRDKQARIVRHAHAIEWEYCHSEFAALLRELRLIKEHRPRFNVAMNVDEAPRGWVALTGGAVPGLRVVMRTDDPDAAVLYGPFRRVSMLTDAVRALADAVGLRDCTLAEPSLGGIEARLARGERAPARRRAAREAVPSARAPGCLRAELGSCIGPCVAAPALPWADAARYDEAVALARDFLAGRTRAPIDALRARMLDAAEQWQFERAGSLKARLEALEWLAERLSRFHAGADRLSFRYRVTGHDGSERVYLVRRGTVRAELTAGDDALDRLADRVFAGPDPHGADIPTHDMDEFYLVASWFRRHPGELARVERALAGV